MEGNTGIGLCEDNGGKTDSGHSEERAAHGRGTGGDRARLGHGAVGVRGAEARRRGSRGRRAGDGDGLIDDSRDDGGDRGRDGLDRVGGASSGLGGGKSIARRGNVARRGNPGGSRVRAGRGGGAVGPGLGRALSLSDWADGGRDGDGLGHKDGGVSRAVGDSRGARDDGRDNSAVDGRGREGNDAGGDNSAVGRAVGHLRAARRDGLGNGGRGSALNSVAVGHNGTGEDNGSSSETHFDSCFGIFRWKRRGLVCG